MADPYSSGNADSWHELHERNKPKATEETQAFKVRSKSSGKILDAECLIRVDHGEKRFYQPRLKATGEQLKFVTQDVLVDSQKNEYEIQD